MDVRRPSLSRITAKLTTKLVVNSIHAFKGRHKNSLPPTTNFSQKLPQSLVTALVTFADVSQNRLCPLPIHYIVIRYPQRMVQMAFCDLLHKYHKQDVTQHGKRYPSGGKGNRL